MLEHLLEFWFFITDRDRSKWYTFSILDLGLMANSGVRHWASGGEDSCIGFWIFIIVMNIIVTRHHNSNND